MTTQSSYHLKELVWFHGWTPTHWILIDSAQGLKAHCTRADARPIGHYGEFYRSEQTITPTMLAKMEKATPGSLPAMMGFDFLLCEGDPGSAVINRPLKFPAR